MILIKLNAINSTNDYLKKLSTTQALENFTTVLAEYQTQGKGQRGNFWQSESGKNLIFSFYIKEIISDSVSVFDLNVAISISIAEFLKQYQIPEIKIKWPNDILSGIKKIGGILIENTFKEKGLIHSVVGIGLNLNQTDFGENRQASSLKNITGKEYDKEFLLGELLIRIKENCLKLIQNRKQELWDSYHKLLFKKDILSEFELPNQLIFNGIIRQVLNNGRLEVEDLQGTKHNFDLKEVKLIY